MGRIILIHILLGIFLPAAIAQERPEELIKEVAPWHKLEGQQLEALRLELKVQSIFIQGAKEIEFSGGRFKSMENAVSSVEEMLVRSHQTIGASNQKQFRQLLNRRGIKEALEKLNRFAFGELAGQARKGFDIGLAFFLGGQIGGTFPALMVAHGHLEYATLLAMPVGPMSATGYGALKAAVKQNQLVKAFGGKEKWKEHQSLLKKVRDFFRSPALGGVNVIDFISGGANYVATVKAPGLIAKILRLTGMSPSLNAEDLSSFLVSQDFQVPMVRTVMSSSAPEDAKLLQLLRVLELAGDEKLMTKMKGQFGAFIREIDPIPDTSAARKWVAKVTSARDFDAFSRMLMSIPDGIPPKIFERIWREHILPSAAKNLGPFLSLDSYRAFRNFENNYNPLRVAMARSIDTKLGPEWKGRLADYIFKSLYPVGGCGLIFEPRGDFAPLL